MTSCDEMWLALRVLGWVVFASSVGAAFFCAGMRFESSRALREEIDRMERP